MIRRITLISALMLLMGALWLAPIHGVYAQEEGATSQSDEVNPRGPGTIILLVGVGAVVLVGLAYWTRKDGSSGTS